MLRRLVVLSGLVFVALTLLAALLVARFDPAELDVDLAGWLAERSGREVSIQGGVHYEFFPWLGLRVYGLRMGQPAALSMPSAPEQEPFLVMRELGIRVRLMPLLLRQEVDFDRVEIVGPELRLQRDASGHDNWHDLVQRLTGGDQDSTLRLQGGTKGLRVSPLSWDGLTLQEGRVLFQDARQGEDLELENLALRAEPGSVFGFTLAAELRSHRHGFAAALTAQGLGRILADPLNLLLQDADFSVEVEWDGADGKEGARLGLQGRADADCQEQSLLLKEATLQYAGLRLSGVLLAERYLRPDYALRGELSLLGCTPGAAPALGEDFAQLCGLLQEATARTSFVATPEHVVLEELRLQLPGAGLQGRADYTRGTAATLGLTMQGGALDLDRLLPPHPGGTPWQLPPWLLFWPGEAPAVTLTLTLDSLTGRGLQARELRLQADFAKGGAQVRVEAAHFLDGALQATLTVREAAHTLHLALQGADAPTLSTLLFGAPHVQGRLDLVADATGRGAELRDLLRSLQLKGEATLHKGALDFTSPPKLLGAERQPDFRFTKATAKLGLAPAKGRSQGAAGHYSYTLQSDFAGLRPQGLFDAPLWDSGYTGTVEGGVKLSGLALLDLETLELLGLENSSGSLRYTGPGTQLSPRRQWVVNAQGKGRLDLRRDLLNLTDVTGTLHGSRFQGSLLLEHLFKPGQASRYSGTIQAPDLAPRELLPHFGLEPPPMAGAGALRHAALQAVYALDERRLDVELQSLLLDDSRITGELFLDDLDKPRRVHYGGRLAVDALDLDAYLPPKPTGPPVEAPAWGNAWLRGLRLTGSCSVGRLRFMGLDHDELRATVSADQDKLQLRPVTARFYGGEFIGQLDVAPLPGPQGLTFSSQVAVADFQLERVMQRLGGGAEVGGTAAWNMTLAGGGKNWLGTLQTLGGKADLSVRDGFYRVKRSTTVPETGRSSTLPHMRGQVESGSGRTPFSRARGTFLVSDGIVRNDDFLVQGLLLQAKGSGQASLPRRTMDYTLLVQMTGAPTIPVRLHGSFANPKVEIRQTEMLTDTLGRLGGSVFGLVKTILTLPFEAVDLLQGK